MPEPDVTVVTATRNRASLLPRLVHALEGQRGAPPFEVIIANDASTDDTASVLEDLAVRSPLPITVVNQPRRQGPGPGRNAGWRRGHGSLVLFVDDDCEPHPDWVARMVAAFDGHDLVQGTTIPAPDQAANLGPFSRTQEVREPGFFQTCNMGYRREVLDAADGFDETFDKFAGEDTDLALRCIEKGASFSFVSDAIVEHDVRPPSFNAAWKDTWRWQGVVRTVGRHPVLRTTKAHSRYFWKPGHPKVIGAAAGIAVALAGRRPWALAAGAVLAVPYLRYRLLTDPLDPSKTGRLKYLPHEFAVDAAEVASLVCGSVRYRTLFL